MNDLLVSKRQKHNGMSWSKKGSVALALITAIERNKESGKWFEKKELEFKFAAQVVEIIYNFNGTGRNFLYLPELEKTGQPTPYL